MLPSSITNTRFLCRILKNRDSERAQNKSRNTKFPRISAFLRTAASCCLSSYSFPLSVLNRVPSQLNAGVSLLRKKEGNMLELYRTMTRNTYLHGFLVSLLQNSHPSPPKLNYKENLMPPKVIIDAHLIEDRAISDDYNNVSIIKKKFLIICCVEPTGEKWQ